MRKLLFVALLFVLAFGSAPAQAYFCWGDDKRDPRDLMRDADVVFTGKVEKLEAMGVAADELKTQRTNVVFKLGKVWKGLAEKDGSKADVDTEAFYDYDFKEGESYLVYGYRIYDGRISMIGCPRIEKVADAAKTIRLLGTPVIDYVSLAEAAAKKAAKAKKAAAPANAPVAATTAPAATPASAPPVVPEPAVQIPPAAAPVQQMDEKSVDNLLDELQSTAAPVAPQDTAPAPAPVAPQPEAQTAPVEAPAPAPKNADEQLDVIWEEGKPEAAAPAPAPAPAATSPDEPLEVIWEEKSADAPAAPPAIPAQPAPPPPMPAPPAPPGGN